MASVLPPTCRPLRATPVHEFPSAVHHDAYVPFLPAKTLVGLRGLCANAANAATTHLRDEAVRRVVARSAALPRDHQPALAAIRDTTPAAIADETVVATSNEDLHLPIDITRVLATVGRDMQVVVWPHRSPMAGAVRRALEHDAVHGSTAGAWALVAPDAATEAPEEAPAARLESFMHRYGVVAVRRDAVAASADQGAAAAHATPGEMLLRLLRSWLDESAAVFVVEGGRTTLGIDARPNSESCLGPCDTVLVASPPTSGARHVIGSARDSGTLEWSPTDARNLKTVDLSACHGLHTIGDEAFRHCASLHSVVFPPGLNALGKHVLAGCHHLFEVDLTTCPHLRSIGDHAFNSCVALETLRFPPSLEAMGQGVLYSCPTLKSVDLRACIFLHSIGPSFCARCASLEAVFFPPGLKSLGPFALESCPKLVAVDLSVTNGELRGIPWFAFRMCAALETVVFPPGLTTLGREVLSDCPKLTAVDLTACGQLRGVADNAFSRCATLRSVAFPPSLESVGAQAFSECAALTIVDLRECRGFRSIAKGAFNSCAALERVVLPPGFKAPDTSSFYQETNAAEPAGDQQHADADGCCARV